MYIGVFEMKNLHVDMSKWCVITLASKLWGGVQIQTFLTVESIHFPGTSLLPLNMQSKTTLFQVADFINDPSYFMFIAALCPSHTK